MLAFTGYTGALLLIGLAVFFLNDVLLVVTVLIFSVTALISLVLSASFGSNRYLICYLFLLLFVTDLNFRTRDYSDYGVDYQNILKMAIWSGSFVIGVIRSGIVSGITPSLPIKLLLLFGVISIASTIWSPSREYTISTSFAFTSFVLFAVGCARSLTYRSIVVASLGPLAFVTSLSLGLLWIVPDKVLLVESAAGIQVTRLSGLTAHPNQLGGIAAISLLLAYVAYSERMTARWIPVAVAAVSAIALLESGSRTAIAALPLIALAYFAWRGPVWASVPTAMVVFAAAILFILAGPLTDVAIHVSRSGRAEEITSLTGRVDLWRYVIGEILRAPLFGHGYAASRELISSEWVARNGWTTTHAHNLLLQSLLSTGLIGTIALLTAFAWQAVRGLASSNSFSMLILWYVILTGLTGTAVAGFAPTAITLVWLLGLSSLASAKRDTPSEGLVTRAWDTPRRGIQAQAIP